MADRPGDLARRLLLGVFAASTFIALIAAITVGLASASNSGIARQIAETGSTVVLVAFPIAVFALIFGRWADWLTRRADRSQ